LKKRGGNKSEKKNVGKITFSTGISQKKRKKTIFSSSCTQTSSNLFPNIYLEKKKGYFFIPKAQFIPASLAAQLSSKFASPGISSRLLHYRNLLEKNSCLIIPIPQEFSVKDTNTNGRPKIQYEARIKRNRWLHSTRIKEFTSQLLQIKRD